MLYEGNSKWEFLELLHKWNEEVVCEFVAGGKTSNIRASDLDCSVLQIGFLVHFFDNRNTVIDEKPVFVKITEEQYKRILVDYLDGRLHTFMQLYHWHRNVYDDVMKDVSAITMRFNIKVDMTDIVGDAEKILAIRGEDRPRHINSPEWGMLEF